MTALTFSHDETLIIVDGPVCSERPQALSGFWRLAADVPKHRVFFAEVAALAGRSFE